MARPLSDDALVRLRESLRRPDLEGTKYQVIQPLARGGMGVVYLARDTELRREVALKVLNAPAPDPGMARRMLREARILARLEHPGIVPVHDVGTLPDGRIFYVMKRVRGESLETHALRKAPLADRLRVMERICEAAAFAHAHGVVHRDLKPSNIMVGEFGEVLVLDWGVARLAGTSPGRPAGGGEDLPDGPEQGPGEARSSSGGALPGGAPAPASGGAPREEATASSGGRASPGAGPDPPARAAGGARGAGIPESRGTAHGAEIPTLPLAETGHGAVLGTPAWMAPEQARGEANVDHRADIFSLGAILHDLLTGRPPSEARSPAEALEAFRSGPPPGPRDHDPSVPRPLDAICRKAMALDPAGRYGDASEMGRDIARQLAGLPPSAYREGPLERVGRWFRRYRTFILLVLAYLAMRVAIFIWGGG